MSDPTEMVHARYLDSTPIVMPGLASPDRFGLLPEGSAVGRCCKPGHHRQDEHEVWERGDPENGVPPQSGVGPLTLVMPGDVILLDRHSAEGRADFEVVGEAAASKPARKRTPKKRTPKKAPAEGKPSADQQSKED